MKKTTIAGAIAALALSFAAAPAYAQNAEYDYPEQGDQSGFFNDGKEFGYWLTLTGTTDYMFRGISQSDQKPAFQADLGASYGDFYGGFWMSTIDFEDTYGPVEFDTYLGWAPVTGAISWDFTAWYYAYQVQDSSLGSGDLNYFEFTGKASINPIDKLTLSLFGAFTPEQDIAITDTQTIEGQFEYAMNDWGRFTPTISGLIGFTNTDIDGYWLGEEDYTYWNAGLNLALDKVNFDFRYWDTDIDNELADSRFVFSAGIALP
ncbi:TorF family putative porin [Methyloligella sp. 2.7D]|uniref:TorF family putative porin n=1 Tax=unclassified Methyloligella TaxID=2625955 RepID=UPI00157CAD3F|nr:TorF family putative porin [Methyloligella sp. GL2]QKP76681.1 hypothetical protein HT051_03970 [Methyloligella sp. GL2]